jgi:glycosyltransferase 2 family protein
VSISERKPACSLQQPHSSDGLREGTTIRISIGTLVKLIISLILFALIAWKLGDLREVGRVFQTISPFHIVLTILAVNLDRALMTIKWKRLLSSLGLQLPFLNGLKIYCASMVWGMVMPMTIGADAVRTYMTARTGLDTKQVVASIIVERVIGFFASLVVGILGFVLLLETGLVDTPFESIWWAGGLFLLIAVVAFGLSFSQRVFDWFDARFLHRFRKAKLARLLYELHSQYSSYRNRKLLLLEFFALSVLEQLTTIFYMWLVALGLKVDVGLVFFAGALPLALLVSRLPVSVHGLGVFDGVFALLLSFAGVSLAEAVAITIGVRVVETAAWLPWWAAYLITSGTGRPKPAPQTSRVVSKPSIS